MTSESGKTERLDEDGRVILDVPDREWAAQVRAMAVVACELCDDDGYRGGTVCDHEDHTEAAKRGMALVREALKRAKARKA